MAKTDSEHLLKTWDSITHAFLFELRNKSGEYRPIFIIRFKDDNDCLHLYLDSASIDKLKLVINGKIIVGSLSEKKVQPGQIARKTFQEIIFNIAEHFTWTYIDPPLRDFLHNTKYIPTKFSNESEVISYLEDLDNKALSGGDQALLEESLKDIHNLSAPITSREEWSVGFIIDGRYEIIDILYGGMGVVYIAEDLEREKFCALKTFQEKYIYNMQVSSQFIKEAEIWTKLGKHKNIVQAERVMIREGRPYIFLEYVDGAELEQILAERPLNIDEALNYSLQFCEGMNYAISTMNLIHRDIKPANCFIDRDNILKISDFGLGKAALSKGIDSEKTEKNLANADVFSSSAMVGTLPYMAPELFSDMGNASIRTDIYSFGVMMYEMFTGTNPFFDEDPTEVIDRHLSLIPKKPSEINAEVPNEVDSIILKSIDKNPTDRFKNFSEIQEALSEVYKAYTGKELAADENKNIFTEEDFIKRGLSLANLGKYDEAIKSYEEAISLNKRSPAILHKGMSLLGMGLYKESLKVFDSFIEIHPDYWKAWFCKGDVLRAMKKFDMALMALNSAEKRMSENAEIIAKTGQIISESGSPKEALSYYEKAIELNNKIPEIWFNYGFSLFLMDKFEAAQEAFTEAIELNPRYTLAWYYNGKSFLTLGFYKEAIKAFNLSLSIDPNHTESLLGIGDTYLETKNFKKAEEYYDLISKKGDMSEAATLSKVKLLSITGKNRTAINQCLSYLIDNPESFAIKSVLANLCLKTQNYESSIQYCNEIINSGRGNSETAQILACAQRRYQYCLNLKQELTQTEPLDVDFTLTDLNTLLSITCDIDIAISEMMKLLEIYPDHEIKIRYLLSLLEKISGNSTSAKWHYDIIKQRAPKSPLLVELGKKIAVKGKENKIKNIFGIGNEKKAPEDIMFDGLVAMRSGNLSEGFTILQSAFLLNKKLYSTLAFCGKILMDMGEPIKALGMFDAFERLFPRSPGIYKYKIKHFRESSTISDMDRYYKQSLALVNNNIDSWFSYVNFLLSTGQTEKTEVTVKLFLSEYLDKILDVDKKKIQKIKGIFLLLNSSADEAVPIFEKMCTEDKSDVIATTMLAQSLILTNKFSMAEKLLLSFECTGEREELFILSLRVDALMGMGNIDLALDFINNSAYASNYTILIKKAEVLLRAKQYNEATQIISSLSAPLELDSSYNLIKQILSDKIGEKFELPDHFSNILNNNFLLKIKGIELYKNKRYIEASEVFQKIISIDELDTEAYFLEGYIFHSMGRYELALEQFQKAAEICNYIPELWAVMGCSACHAGQKDKANLYFLKAIKQAASSPEIITNYSAFLIEEGSLLSAQQYAEKALRIDNKYSEAWIIRGRCLKMYGNLEDALMSAESSLLLDSNNIRGWLLKGSIQIELEDYSGALNTLRKASELDDSEAVVWYNLALITLLQRKYEAAYIYSDKAIKRNPMIFDVLHLYAVCNLKTGKKDKYNEAMKRIAEMDIAKFNKIIKIQNLRNSVIAPLKPLDTTSEPFRFDLMSKRKLPYLFNLTDLTSNINVTES